MVSRDAPIGSRHDGPVRVANGDNHKSLDHDEILKATTVSPKHHCAVAGSPRILNLVDYRLEVIVLKSAYAGPASLDHHPAAGARR
jgi:acetoacetate decarboxylase